MTAPERIYGWRNTQLSVAKWYGGCTYQGKNYIIDVEHPDEPLLRVDVMASEKKAKLQLKTSMTRAEVERALIAQRNLI